MSAPVALNPVHWRCGLNEHGPDFLLVWGDFGLRPGPLRVTGHGTLRDGATGQIIRTLTGHTSFVVAVACSPDGTLLAAGSHDKTARLWALG
jgi:WD40 repeat protein